MRIGYLIPEFPGQTHAFFWREMSAIEDLGDEVVLLSTRRAPEGTCPHDFAQAGIARTTYLFPPKANLGVINPAALSRASKYIRSFDDGGSKAQMRAAALLPSARMLASIAKRERLDFVHIHSAANAAHLGALARCYGGAPFGITLHGDLPVYGTDHRAKMTHAALVTAVTDPLRQQINSILPEIDVPVIPMGVDTNRFSPTQRERSGPLKIVSVARLNYVKGHTYTLQAMEKLRSEGIETTARFLGNGPYEAEIKQDIADRGLQDVVTMPGAVPETQVIEELQQADVLVLSSFGQGEAAPVAVMEAMATGTPVICSRIGGTGDMIDDGEDGFLVPQEQSGPIADRLRQLTTNEDLYKRLSDAARQTALTRFDHRARAKQLRDAIADRVRQNRN